MTVENVLAVRDIFRVARGATLSVDDATFTGNVIQRVRHLLSYPVWGVQFEISNQIYIRILSVQHPRHQWHSRIFCFKIASD